MFSSWGSCVIGDRIWLHFSCVQDFLHCHFSRRKLLSYILDILGGLIQLRYLILAQVLSSGCRKCLFFRRKVAFQCMQILTLNVNNFLIWRTFLKIFAKHMHVFYLSACISKLYEDWSTTLETRFIHTWI